MFIISSYSLNNIQAINNSMREAAEEEANLINITVTADMTKQDVVAAVKEII